LAVSQQTTLKDFWAVLQQEYRQLLNEDPPSNLLLFLAKRHVVHLRPFHLLLQIQKMGCLSLLLYDVGLMRMLFGEFCPIQLLSLFLFLMCNGFETK